VHGTYTLHKTTFRSVLKGKQCPHVMYDNETNTFRDVGQEQALGYKLLNNK